MTHMAGEQRGFPIKLFLNFALIIIIGFIAYSNSFRVPFQLDDALYITENPLVKNPVFFAEPSQFCEKVRLSHDDQNRCSAFKRRFVGYLTFTLNYRLHNTRVLGYHVVNLIIHLMNAVLIYLFVVLTLRTPALARIDMRSTGSLIALFSALLFVSHPVQTQAVTYIAQRFTSLVTMCYLFSLVSYAKWRIDDAGARRFVFYASSIVSAVLAMETKEIAFTLPGMIVLYEFFFFTGSVRKRVLYLIPFLLTMVLIPVSLLEMNKPIRDILSDSGSWKVLTDMSRWDYLFTEFAVIATYIRLLFFPINQNVLYDYPIYHSFFVSEVLLSFLLLVSIFGAGIYLWVRYRDEIPQVRLIIFGIFWFFISLSVESSIIPIADVIFEHRVYLPSGGAFLAATTGFFMIAEKLDVRRSGTAKTAVGIFMVIVIILTGATYARNIVWQNEVALWEDVVKKSPNKALGYLNLGLALSNRKQFDKALAAYEKVIAIDPLFYKVYNNRGTIYSEIGEYNKAINDFTMSAALYPDEYQPYLNRGIGYINIGEYDKALNDFSKVIAITPYCAEAYNNRGTVYGRRGMTDNAIEDFTRAISLSPNFDGFYVNRGRAFVDQREYNGAIKDFTAAIGLNPMNAEVYMLRGAVFVSIGNSDNAMLDFQKACETGRQDSCNFLNSIQLERKRER